jgi:hypothetical protein
MIIMSLRDGGFPSKQSPVSRGDCFATCARNDMQGDALRELQVKGGEELSALMPSVLDKAFKGELFL